MSDEYHEILEKERDELLGPFITFLGGNDEEEPLYINHEDLQDYALYSRGEWEGTIGSKAFFEESQAYPAARSPRKRGVEHLQGVDRTFIVFDFDREHYYDQEIEHMNHWQERNSQQISGHIKIFEIGSVR